MKDTILVFIHIYTDGLVGRNLFSVGIDATKSVKSLRLYHYHKSIVGGSQPNHFVSVEVMDKDDIQCRINLTRSE